MYIYSIYKLSVCVCACVRVCVSVEGPTAYYKPLFWMCSFAGAVRTVRIPMMQGTLFHLYLHQREVFPN